jgi:hypothetical protein
MSAVFFFKEKRISTVNQLLWYMFVISALRRLKQEDQEFKT